MLEVTALALSLVAIAVGVTPRLRHWLRRGALAAAPPPAAPATRYRRRPVEVMRPGELHAAFAPPPRPEPTFTEVRCTADELADALATINRSEAYDVRARGGRYVLRFQPER